MASRGWYICMDSGRKRKKCWGVNIYPTYHAGRKRWTRPGLFIYSFIQLPYFLSLFYSFFCFCFVLGWEYNIPRDGTCNGTPTLEPTTHRTMWRHLHPFSRLPHTFPPVPIFSINQVPGVKHPNSSPSTPLPAVFYSGVNHGDLLLYTPCKDARCERTAVWAQLPRPMVLFLERRGGEGGERIISTNLPHIFTMC